MTFSTDSRPPEHEVVVVGGGPAGLQAALTLGRVHRDTVLVDAGQGRNAPAAHMHNLITRDGTAPEEFRRLAREELRSYPTVELREGRVRALRPAGTSGEDGRTAYLVELEDGPPVQLDGLFAPTTMHQAAPFAEQLGLGLNESGCTRVDDSCRTSLPRVYAAGDMAHVEALPMPMTSVAQAIASGALAGATAVKDLVEDEIG